MAAGPPPQRYEVLPVAFRAPATIRDERLLRMLEARARALPHRTNWSCVPYARAVSGIQIRGDAWRWWANAAGQYQRGHEPEVGAVIVLSRSARLRRGHVAVVREVVSPREVIVVHANWVRRGRVVPSMRVIDVSANNDWSRTRWWYEPGQTFGGVYPTSGFIYPDEPDDAGGSIIAAVTGADALHPDEVSSVPDAESEAIVVAGDVTAPEVPTDTQLDTDYLTDLAALPEDPPELELSFETQLAELLLPAE